MIKNISFQVKRQKKAIILQNESNFKIDYNDYILIYITNFQKCNSIFKFKKTFVFCIDFTRLIC